MLIVGVESQELSLRSGVRYEHFLERKARKIFFRHSALDKSGKGYGITGLHLIYFVWFYFHSS